MIENVPFCGEFIGNVHHLFARVYYSDTDFTGVVYHARYLEFFERGRSEFIRLSRAQHQKPHNTEENEKLGWVVHKIAVNYHKSARFDDILDIRTKIIKVTGARIVMAQEIIRNDLLLVSADVQLALVNSEGRPTRIPDEFIESWENTTMDK